ncbi:hypothetical protein SAFG77S_13491 [Streptomyces afghaniensis]
MRKLKIGIIGCGNISSVYIENFPKLPYLELVACADLDTGRAPYSSQKIWYTIGLFRCRITLGSKR